MLYGSFLYPSQSRSHEFVHPPLPPTRVQVVVTWVLGEYGVLAAQQDPPVPPAEVMTLLADLALRQGVKDEVRGYVLSALAKLAAQTGELELPAAAGKLLR